MINIEFKTSVINILFNSFSDTKWCNSNPYKRPTENKQKRSVDADTLQNRITVIQTNYRPTEHKSNWSRR